MSMRDPVAQTEPSRPLTSGPRPTPVRARAAEARSEEPAEPSLLGEQAPQDRNEGRSGCGGDWPTGDNQRAAGRPPSRPPLEIVAAVKRSTTMERSSVSERMLGTSPLVTMAKPSTDPEYFQKPPPPGRSRESTIVLAADGHFKHDGENVDHPRMGDAMHTWIARHPDDGRYILDNGYDWTYFTVEDAPYFVRTVTDDGTGFPLLLLSDGSEEPLGTRLRLGGDDSLYVEVKSGSNTGPFEAKFSRHAQSLLGPYLVEKGDGVAVRTRHAVVPLPL